MVGTKHYIMGTLHSNGFLDEYLQWSQQFTYQIKKGNQINYDLFKSVNLLSW